MSSRGRPKRDYTDRKFGLVTVVRREGNKLWCRCECGVSRWYELTNLMSHGPKTHFMCVKSEQFELDLGPPK